MVQAGMLWLIAYALFHRCPTYTNIPPICRLVDQAGSCCKRIECPSTSVTLPPGPTQAPPNTPPPTFDPLCHDAIDNCNAYGSDACGKTYEAWARRNCNLTCGFCSMFILPIFNVNMYNISYNIQLFITFSQIFFHIIFIMYTRISRCKYIQTVKVFTM